MGKSKVEEEIVDEQLEAGDNDNNSDDRSSNSGQDGIDPVAFADILSEKDRKIEQLEQDIAELKRSNANLIVKVNAATQPTQPKKTFEEKMLNLVGAKPRKE